MKSSPGRWRLATAAIAATIPFAAAQSQAEPATAELHQRIEELSQKLLVLERKLELQDETAQAAAKSTPVVKASPKGFSLQSADSQNVVKLRGTLHFDGRRFTDDVTTETSDTWLLRRVRPTLEGTLGGIYDFRFTPDFAGGRTIILDAFATARLQPWLAVTAGKFKVPVGLERLQSANDIRFIERGFPTGLLPNRDLGVSLAGDLFGGVASYSLGYYNGVTDGGSSDAIGDVDTDTAGDYAARFWLNPFADSDSFALRGLGFGIGGTYVDVSGSPTNTLLPSYRTPGQQTFFRYRSASTTQPAGATYADGERVRWSPQFYYSFGRLGLLGEYAEVSQDVTRTTAAGTFSDTVDVSAWQLAAHYFLTGEEQSFKGFKPNTTFSLASGTWGAFELVARYHEMEISDEAFAGGADSFADPATSPDQASAYGIGVNWYLNENLKLALNYERTSFEGGAAGGADREDEEVFLTRVAVGF
jgi:phosphate-selective porin OprO/OprP